MLRASANIGHSGKSALPAPVCVSRADVDELWYAERKDAALQRAFSGPLRKMVTLHGCGSKWKT